jgi:hypothetical protein
MHPYSCAMRKGPPNSDRRFLIAFAGTIVKGKHVGSFLSTQARRLLHVFEID